MIPSVQQFLKQQGFPAGASAVFDVDLLGPQALAAFLQFMNMGKLKEGFLRGLLRQFPERKFYLFGDSVVSDPGTYGNLLREFGVDRIPMTIIRQCPMTFPYSYRNRPGRFEADFDGVPRSAWKLITEPSEIPPLSVVR